MPKLAETTNSRHYNLPVLHVAVMPQSKQKKTTSKDEGKTSKRGVRTRKGKLESLPNMPLDVLFEVCSLSTLR